MKCCCMYKIQRIYEKKSHRTNWVQQDHRYKVKIKPIVYLYISNEYVGGKKLKYCTIYQFSSATQSCLTLCDPMTAAHQGSLRITNSRSLLKLISIESVMSSNHLILCHLLLLWPSIFPSIRVFSNESALHIRWPKYWSLSFSIVFPMNIQGWFPLALTGLIFLQSKGLSRVFFNTTVQKYQFFGGQLSL